MNKTLPINLEVNTIYLITKISIDTGFRFFWLIYMLLAIQNKIPDVQITLVQVIFFQFINLFLEVPTGIFADKYGKKLSTLIGLCCFILAFPSFVFLPNIWGLGAMFLLLSIGNSFISGALDAILINKIGTDNLKQITVKNEMISSIAGIITRTAIGFLAYKVGFSSGLLFGSVFFVLALIMAILYLPKDIPNPQPKKHTQHWQAIWSNPNIRNLILISSGWAFSISTYIIYWNVNFFQYFKEWSGAASSVISFGILTAGILLTRFKVVGKINFTYLILVGSILMFLTTFSLPKIALLALFFSFGFEIISNIFRINLFAGINTHFENEERATMNSIKTLFDKVGEGLGLILAGYASGIIGRENSWYISVVSLLVLGLVTIVFNQRPESKKISLTT
jgi:MFS family permease